MMTPTAKFAAFATSALAAYVCWMGYLNSTILSSPQWCHNILGAEKALVQDKDIMIADLAKTIAKSATSESPPVQPFEACINLMRSQLDAVATNSHINTATIAVVVLAMFVIVYAGGKLSFEGSAKGLKGSLERGKAIKDGDVVEAELHKKEEK